MKYILAIDQGTSSSRCILYDQQANQIAMAQQEFEQLFPKPGWVEHNAEEIWQTQAGVFKQVMMQLHLCPADIAGIGITNQRETTVVWERRTGKPIYNAIVWQDRRTADECTRLKEAGLEPKVKAKTGLVIDAYFSASKVRWILDEVIYALEVSVFIGGAVIQWLRDGLMFFEHAEDSEKLAESVADNGGVYFVPALTGLGAPHWNPHARGAIFGITRGTNRAHITRAALESICFQVDDLLKILAADSNESVSQLRIDGGAAVNNLLVQFQADISAIEVIALLIGRSPRWVRSTWLALPPDCGASANLMRNGGLTGHFTVPCRPKKSNRSNINGLKPWQEQQIGLNKELVPDQDTASDDCQITCRVRMCS